MKLIPTGLVIKLPLFFTRQALYGVIIFTAIFFVLLPASTLTYFSFYKNIIPTERVGVPTKFMGVAGTLETQSQISFDLVLPFLRQNQDLEFSVRLNLHAICKVEKLFQVLRYQLNFDSGNSFSDEILVNCDSRYIYVAKNNWIPYNLRYWTPPILVDILKLVTIDEKIVTLPGRDLILLIQNRSDDSALVFEDTRVVLLDSKKLSLDFVIEWDGIRYYLVKYYWTSLILGAGCIWVMSSWFCILTAIATLVYFAPEQTVKVKKE